MKDEGAPHRDYVLYITFFILVNLLLVLVLIFLFKTIVTVSCS